MWTSVLDMVRATKGVRRKLVDKAYLWLDQPFLGFIYHNLEDLLLDQSLGEETPLDLDASVLIAEGLLWQTCGRPHTGMVHGMSN